MDSDIPQIMKDISRKYNVQVQRDEYNCGNNYASSSINQIWLGKFDNIRMELVAFFHELDHCVSNIHVKRKSYFTKISQEGLAWEVGLDIAKIYGFNWDYYSNEMIWARNQYKSYIMNVSTQKGDKYEKKT